MKKALSRSLLLLLLLFVSNNVKATHLVGGEITYSRDSTGAYQVSLTMYRDCSGIGFPGGVFVDMYDASTGSTLSWGYFSGGTVSTVPNSINAACVTNVPNFCVEKRVYSGTINYTSATPNGVRFEYSTCCRNSSISNITFPGSTGMTWECTLYPGAIGTINSSPVFSVDPPTIIPSGDTVSVPFTATDADGDSLWYEFVSAKDDNGSSVSYVSGYSGTDPLPSQYPAYIDGNTGTIWTNLNQVGQYVVSVAITEYRNGVALSKIQRDYQFNIATYSSMDLVLNNIFQPISCTNPMGSIGVQTVNGTAPFTYTWSTGASTPSITNLSPGIYEVEVVDSVGCEDSLTVEIHDPSVTVSSITVISPATCSTSSDGVVEVIAQGDNGPFTYRIGISTQTAQSTGLFSQVQGGNNQVVVEDSAGTCIIDTIVNVPVRSSWHNTVQDSVSSISCNGNGDGYIHLSDTTSGLSYSWIGRPSLIGLMQNSLSAGSYDLLIEESTSGCSDTLSFQLMEPDPLRFNNTTIIQPYCADANNSEVNFTPIGGTSPYNLTADNSPATLPVQGLTPGQHSFRITDSNGCIHDTSVTLTAPATWNGVVLDSTVNPVCYGAATGEIYLSDSQPQSSYSWLDAPGLQTLSRTGIAAGSYSLRVSLAGCEDTIQAAITQPAELRFDSIRVITPFCSAGTNGSILWGASGGTGNIVTRFNSVITTKTGESNLDTGAYVLEITDQNSCTVDSTIRILGNSVWHGVYFFSKTDLTCYEGGTGQIVVKDSLGGANYQWLDVGGNTSLSRNNLNAGSYTLRVYESGSCEDTINVELFQPAEIQVGSIITSFSYCDTDTTGTLSWSASGGTGSLSGFIDTLAIGSVSQGLTPGTRNLTIVDQNGCEVDTAFSIMVDNSWQQASVQSTSVTSCFGSDDGEAVLDTAGMPIERIAWADTALSSTYRTGMNAGDYYFIYGRGLGCWDTVAVSITQPQPIAVSSLTVDSASCALAYDATISWSATGGNGGYTASVDSNQFNGLITGLDTGYTTITITDSLGCLGDTTVFVGNLSSWHSFDTLSLEEPSCFGDSTGAISVNVNSQEAYSLLWSFGTDTTSSITNVPAGAYTVTVFTAAGCSEQYSFNLNEPSDIDLNAVFAPERCRGDSSAFIEISPTGGTGSKTASWFDYLGFDGLRRENLDSGGYLVTAIDSLGCMKSDSIFIINPSPLSFTYTLEQETSCFLNDGNAAVEYSGGISPYVSFAIGTSNDTLSVDSLTAGVYTIVAQDSNGCTSTQMDSITTDEPYRVYIPNAFTPNNDGINDSFIIDGNPMCFTNAQFMIKDYWGQIVYFSEDPFNEFWDGQINGQATQPKYYEYYFISDEYSESGKMFVIK